MFRDSEIIQLICSCESGITEKLTIHLKQLNNISDRIADLESDNSNLRGIIEEQSIILDKIYSLSHSESGYKQIMKEAMREFKEEMETPAKKVIKKK